jgi:hypothetical protein
VRSWPYPAWFMTLALVSFVREARADGGPVVFEAAVCADSAEHASERLAPMLPRRGAEEPYVFVRVERRGVAYRAMVRLQNATRDEIETVIDAASCEEALDAVVVVLALAFGTDRAAASPAGEPAAVLAEASPPLSAPPAADAATAGASFLDRTPPGGAVGAPYPADQALRIALATGADSGTLPVATLYVSGAVARSLAAFELRGVVRYGLPTVDDSAEDGASQSERNDFGALELRGCYGIGSRLRLSGCTGTELGAVRRSRRWQSEERTGEESALDTRFSGVLAAAVAHRAGPIQPELELSGAAVAFGREPEASWLVLRMSLGAALAF